MAKQKIIIIQGPTGVGKTGMALRLADMLPVEIINADSMQFYRYLDIGTSKPSAARQQAVPHHLFSIVNPDESFSAARFKELGREAIRDIGRRHGVPVIVGGTGLYIRALLQGLCEVPDRDERLRLQLSGESSEVLFERLRKVDPESCTKIDPHDRVRLIRALEVNSLTGEPLSAHHRRHSFQDRPYDSLQFCLTRQRDELYRIIDRRVDDMIARGLLREVLSVMEQGFSAQLKPLQSIGYRQMTAYIQGRITWQVAVAQMKTRTRHFAKRQLTWFRNEPDLVWVRLPEEAGRVEALSKKFLNID